MSKEKIMELVERTANHLGIISKGSLETLCNQVRSETIKEIENCLIKNVSSDGFYSLNQIKQSLNNLK